MAYTVTAVSILDPTSDPNINEAGTFSFDGETTLTGNHLADYDAHFQWDQGTATWTDLTGSGALAIQSGTNPQNNLTGADMAAITIVGNTAGSYQIRIQTVDHNDGDATDTSSAQDVTVNASATRRVFVIS